MLLQSRNSDAEFGALNSNGFRGALFPSDDSRLFVSSFVAKSTTNMNYKRKLKRFPAEEPFVVSGGLCVTTGQTSSSSSDGSRTDRANISSASLHPQKNEKIAATDNWFHSGFVWPRRLR